MKIIAHSFVNENGKEIKWTERQFDIGETVWVILGELIVKCVVTHIDDSFRKESPNAYLFYSIDEPVGHDLPEDELFLTKQEASSILLSTNRKHKNRTLEEVRDEIIWFIAGTHAGYYLPSANPGEKDKQKKEIFEKQSDVFDHFKATLKPKTRGIDWFSYADLQSTK